MRGDHPTEVNVKLNAGPDTDTDTDDGNEDRGDAAGRVFDRVNQLLGGGDADDEDDAPEDEPEGDEPAGSEDETDEEETSERPAASKKGKEAKPDQETPAGEGEEPDDLEPVFELDGKQYTASELREFRDGAMRQEDYTRKSQANAEERKRFEQEKSDRKALTDLLRQQTEILNEMRRGRSGQGDRPDEGDEIDPETGQPVAPARKGTDAESALRERLEKVNERLEQYETREKEREQARQQQEYDDFLLKNADETLNALCDKYKVPKALRGMYADSVFGRNPKVRDANGRVTAQSIATAITREFTKVHSTARAHIKQEINERLGTLTKETPHKAKPGKAGAPGKERPESQRAKKWDSDRNTDRITNRVAQLLGEGRSED